MYESTLVDLIEKYFFQFGDKVCCFKDLHPCVDLGTDAKLQWISFHASQESSFATTGDLQWVINLSTDKELYLASTYIKEYMVGLELDSSLPVTEHQPADDITILIGHVFVSLWTMTKDKSYLYNAAVVLEFALMKSCMSFQIQLLLVCIYHLLGASSLALDHYCAINIKQVQDDTLSHFLLTQASTFSLSASGDLTYPSECIESSQIYVSNSQDIFTLLCFQDGDPLQIPEFVSFDDKLENSLQCDVIKLEHVCMQMTHEPINSDLIDMELIELNVIHICFRLLFSIHHDNWDFGMLPNYQPACQPLLNDQTLMFGSSTGQGWLWYFIKIYICAFQHASDLDDIVKEKLLIGDQPKKSPEPEVQLPLREHLAVRTPEEAAEASDWLANKQNELRTRLPLRGVDLKALNGDTNINGHAKKDEEAPPVKEPSQLVAQFFKYMHTHFMLLQQSQNLPSDLPHVATLTQEAFLLFAVGSHHFKTTSVVKIHKLGALVQLLKDIRLKACTVLKTMSNNLLKLGEVAGFIESCKPITDFPTLHHDFVLNIAKSVSKSRKKVLKGIGKGMVKICTNYGQ
ncbi:N-acetyltransferase B complex non catalytic subunit-domain-containing protein [Suillus subaureus]|uniref:N-acetyltransferase B complex non catalytic subunit-domain-containing protein n=1 Tax=Suillus subaureus TaxID=48587 RepID=A0A9P7EC40_9AGAM|nr:N-acetyltransferase B complex non catalytic subunit-domain-containing protein [Suillus subaureus]KAG1817547.1 N-acetyltransferase B complex non catalytic subunit-domain-containing protein [Suillus subaureus]